MVGTLQPLDQKFAIVDSQGRPTRYFTEWAQQKQIDIGDSAATDDLAAYALLAAPNVFTAAPQTVQGTGGITLQDTSASAGFSILERASTPGHQIFFQSNAPVTAAGATLHVFANLATAASKNISQIALWTITPTATNAAQAVIRAVTGTSGEEMFIFTRQIGTGITAGDIVFLPNNVEKLRILAAAGDPAVKVTGQLSVTDDAYGPAWNGSTDVPTKNAVYDKIETIAGGGGGGGVSTIGSPGAVNGTDVPGVNNYIARKVIADVSLAINKVAFMCQTATPTAVYQPFIYLCSPADVMTTLMALGPQVTGTVAGYNEIPLSTPAALVKGNFYIIGVNVITHGIDNIHLTVAGSGFFHANGGSTVPASPAPSGWSGGNIYGFWGVA